MEQHDGLVQTLGEANEPLERLDLAHPRMADTVEFRLDIAAGHQPVGHPGDHAVVLGMGADQGAVPAGDHHHVEHLLVEEAYAIIGHEDLDRAVPGFDQTGQILLKRFRRRIGNP